MVAWPEQFCPLINSFQETPPENTIRSTMDKGPAKVRRRTTANIRSVSFTVSMKPAEVTIMDNFYLDDTFSGAIAFDFTHPRTKEVVSARFTSPPTYSNRSTIYQVAVSLEILP